MSFGEDGYTELTTMRGRDYPALTQFTIFLENRVGQLKSSGDLKVPTFVSLLSP